MMFSKLKSWRIAAMLGLLALGAVIALGAGRTVPSVIHVPGEGDRLVPRVQIIQFDDTVARFDTATGEIHRFHGDLDKPQVRSEWVRHVPGVSGNTSGLLQLQKASGVRAKESVFLVDTVTGDTWILRRRGATADWDRVRIAR